MSQETFALSQEELQRVSVISSCVKGNLTCARAAVLLDLSPRQVKRLKSRYRQGGEAALAHVSRGRLSHRRQPQPLRDRILHLARTTYVGFNDHHLCEKLCEVEGFSLGRETLRRLLRSSGIGSPRKRRAPTHRQRRLCRAREGEMLLLDGSLHRWLEDRGPQLTLLGFLDDATRKVLVAEFFPTEDARGYFRLLRRLLSRCGVPSASTAIITASSFATTITGRWKNNWPAVRVPRNSAAPWSNSASPTSLPIVLRPKAALSGCGAPFKIVSPASFVWLVPSTWKRPMGYCAISFPTTTAALLARPAIPKRPGVLRPKISTASSAFITSVRSATTMWCSGTAAASKSRRSHNASASPGRKCSSTNLWKERLLSITEKTNSNTPRG